MAFLALLVGIPPEATAASPPPKGSFRLPSYAISLDSPETLAALKPVGKDFSFIVLGHVRSNNFLRIYHHFYLAMQAVKALKPDFIVFTGDFTYGDHHTLLAKPPYWNYSRLAAEWNLFKSFVDGYKIPYFVVPGNHELWGGMEAEKIYRSIFGATSGSFRMQGFNFVFLNTTIPHETYFTKISQAQKDSLSQFKGEADRTFLFLHHPIWKKQYKTSLVYNDYEIKYAFAGDNENFELNLSDKKVQIISGLESRADDFKAKVKKFFSPSSDPVNFVRVMVKESKVSIFKVVVTPETGKFKAEKVY